VTDFSFMEIWRFHTRRLADLVDICSNHRRTVTKRVILKLYPADMSPGQASWPEPVLRRLLGATMTGAGSLMVVGEPNETTGRMNALHSLYYPDHQPLPAEDERLLKDYYGFDALMYGYTHGRDVLNTGLLNPIEDCITRTYLVPAKKSLVVQILNLRSEDTWTNATPDAAPRENVRVDLTAPGGVAPRSVFFASPDSPAYETPVRLIFQMRSGKIWLTLPELQNYAALIFTY